MCMVLGFVSLFVYVYRRSNFFFCCIRPFVFLLPFFSGLLYSFTAFLLSFTALLFCFSAWFSSFISSVMPFLGLFSGFTASLFELVVLFFALSSLNMMRFSPFFDQIDPFSFSFFLKSQFSCPPNSAQGSLFFSLIQPFFLGFVIRPYPCSALVCKLFFFSPFLCRFFSHPIHAFSLLSLPSSSRHYAFSSLLQQAVYEILRKLFCLQIFAYEAVIAKSVYSSACFSQLDIPTLSPY